ncbi:hypothetical protein BD410DRAFT_901830 [Rickenella mellea]|uniref:F-box domain-containing protein n=1 Tax=Rickenella mellea TaxID=50990 RepID=A0A4Y7PN00_9AGAM|nr:hypothetical protein BD410DRAFT_901830 [Rickenella mellea]
MHRALTIPELLDIIFSSTNELANARAVSVCKTWSGVARDALWRDVRGLHRLFCLLAPVIRYSSHYEFQRRIEPSDWTNFNTMATRIKHFTVEDLEDRKFRDIDLGMVATTRRSIHILPNLTQLTLTMRDEGQFWFSVIFLHENLQRLVLKIPDAFPPQNLLTEVSLRCAKLCYLDLEMSNPSRVEGALADMLSSLTNLKTVIMPCYTISSPIMTSLTRLPNLGTIQSQCFTDRGSEDPAAVQPFSPVLHEGAFPSLRKLTFDSNLCDTAAFFTANFAPVNITYLCVQTASIETPLSFFECLTTLSHTCEKLRVLAFYLTVDGSRQTFNEISESISFKDICPILDLPHLTAFELTHYRPLDISDDNIDHLARNWPELVSLDLNPGPVVLENPKITFGSFSSLARHCPKLGRLGLFLDPSPDNLPTPAVPFKMLNTLDLGTSPIQSEVHDQVALYLSEICHFLARWRLESGVIWCLSLTSWATPILAPKFEGDRRSGDVCVISYHYLPSCDAKRDGGRKIWKESCKIL